VQHHIVHSKPERFAAHPLAQLAAVFALGIVGETYIAVPLLVVLAIATLTTVAATTAFLYKAFVENPASNKTQKSLRRKFSVPGTLVIAATLLLGWSLASIEKTKVSANQLKRLLDEGSLRVGEPVELTGVLERDPELAPQRFYLSLRMERIRLRSSETEVSGSVMLLAPVPGKSVQEEFDQLELRYGARIRVMTMLERTDSFRNPGVSSFTEYLDRKGYDATGLIKSPLLIERLENARVFLPLAWLYEWRQKLELQIDARFSRETASVLDAAFLGNRYKLSSATAERFREGGTFHALVISGLHITVLGALVFLIAGRFTKNRALQFLLTLSVLWGYSFAVGAESSVMRAALMFTIVLAAPLVSRRASSLNALGGTALVLLAWRPSDLLDPSFQLTFISVLAIVILAVPLTQKLQQVGRWRPTRETPYPPNCAPWLRSFCESLFWSEREGQLELNSATCSYKLFKTPLAGTLERVRLQRWLRYAFEAFLISVCVVTTLLPFLVVYFHRLSFASLILNIGVSVLMAGVAMLAAAALLIAQVSSALAAPLISLTNSLNWTMVHSVDPFTKIGVASIRLPEYTGWAKTIYVFYYAPLTMLSLSLSRWKPLDLPRARAKSKGTANLVVVFAQLLTLALIVFHPLSAGRPSGKLRVDFLDVGQGDSALVTFPDNTTLLIDGGGRPGPFKPDSLSRDAAEGEETFERETRSIGEAVVSEYLWWRGLDHVDYILATHADADHIDGLNDVARNFKVRAALVARTPGDDQEYAKFSQTLLAENIPIGVIGAGDVLRFGDVTASVLSPPPSANPDAPSRNNDSVVLRLQMGERALLLTGDIEVAGETGMLQAPENLRADVVKVAHHGSKTSSTEAFIAAAQPRFAIISVGQTSIFGHPNREVVERWKSSGAQVLTTGSSGTITVRTDGRDLKLETFVREHQAEVYP
jgi:competence protein ComEC